MAALMYAVGSWCFRCGKGGARGGGSGVIHRVPHLAWGAKIKVPGLAMGRTFSRTNKIYDSLLCTS